MKKIFWNYSWSVTDPCGGVSDVERSAVTSAAVAVAVVTVAVALRDASHPSVRSGSRGTGISAMIAPNPIQHVSVMETSRPHRAP